MIGPYLAVLVALFALLATLRLGLWFELEHSERRLWEGTAVLRARCPWRLWIDGVEHAVENITFEVESLAPAVAELGEAFRATQEAVGASPAHEGAGEVVGGTPDGNGRQKAGERP